MKKEQTTRSFGGDLKIARRNAIGGATDLSHLAKQMVGATIVGIGFHDEAREGGFAIDFQHDKKPMQRLVLGYTELGEWIEYLGRADGRK